MSNVRNIHFEAVGSYLRPAELKEARAKFADGQISATDLRAVEDREWPGKPEMTALLHGHLRVSRPALDFPARGSRARGVRPAGRGSPA